MRRIDPETGSYVMTDGAWEYDETGGSQIHQAIMTRKGSVPADSTLGCELWNEDTLDASVEAKAKGYLEDAVQPLIDEGIIDSFTVVYAEIDADNPSRLDYGYVWVAGGEEQEPYDGNLAIGSE